MILDGRLVKSIYERIVHGTNKKYCSVLSNSACGSKGIGAGGLMKSCFTDAAAGAGPAGFSAFTLTAPGAIERDVKLGAEVNDLPRLKIQQRSGDFQSGQSAGLL